MLGRNGYFEGKLETADRQGKDLSRKLKDTLQSNADLQEKLQLAKSKEQELTLQLRIQSRM